MSIYQILCYEFETLFCGLLFCQFWLTSKIKLTAKYPQKVFTVFCVSIGYTALSSCQLISRKLLRTQYQLPLILTALLHTDLINLGYLTTCVFIRSWWRVTFEWLHQWRWIDTNIDNYAIIASLKSERIGKQINWIPGSRFLISSLPDSASRTHVESLGKPRDSTSVLEALLGILDITRHSPRILYFRGHHFYMYMQVKR